MIDAEGQPTSCHIHWPTLEEGTNKKICDALMDKARFTPALDGEGAPMASYFVTPVFFLLPPPPGS